MSHYEERLQHDLDEIRDSVVALGKSVEKGVETSLQALFEHNNALAYQTILGDNPINRASEALNMQCHHFVARHLPSAGHLRFISSVLRINIGLERIGDYAVTISREAAVLTRPLKDPLGKKVRVLGEHALSMFRSSLLAFRESDYDNARRTMAEAAKVDDDFDEAFKQLIADGSKGTGSVEDMFGKLVIISNLERVSDQAKNLCEDIVFALTGETKRRRPARVLFLGDDENVTGPMAVAIGRKAFPDSGAFACAGRAANGLSPDLIEFLADHGHDPTTLRSIRLDDESVDFGHYDVLVSLSGPMSQYVAQVPFRSVALEWSLPDLPDSGTSETGRKARYVEIYRQLAVQITDLLETLRG